MAEDVESGPTISDVIERLPKHVYDNPTALGLLYFARDLALYEIGRAHV